MTKLKLSKTTDTRRSVLEKVAAARLKEARALKKAGCYAGAVYLAGYAVECWLKVAICKALDCLEMPRTFRSHDLDVLLLHSGLVRRIDREPGVSENFGRISGVWAESIRYEDPKSFDEAQVDDFFRWVCGRHDGVVTWVRKQLAR